MLDHASFRVASEPLAGTGDIEEPLPVPATDEWEWQSLFAAAGFAMEEAQEPDELALVQRQVSVESAPRVSPILLSRLPVSVFELAQKPVEVHYPPERAHVATTACRIVRSGNVTRCINVPIKETAEWLETERQRRARQKPPRPPRQRFKVKGSKTWADDGPRQANAGE